MLLLSDESLLIRVCIFYYFWYLLLPAGSNPVRACPEPKGACRCDFMTKTVECVRLNGIGQSIPVAIPENTLRLTIQQTSLRRIETHAFQNNKDLEDIDLSENSLEEISSFAFHKLVNLKNLSLAENKLSFLNEEVFASLHGLLQLNLSHNRLIAFAPRNFQKLRNLQLLDLRNNPIICMSPDAFSGLSTLKEFQISHVQSKISKDLLVHLPSLVRLSITSIPSLTNFHESFLLNNEYITDLNFEYLTSLELKGVPENLLTRQKSLQKISFSACNLTEVPSAVLDRVKWTLLSLDLSKNPMTCIRHRHLSFLFRLRHLNLKQTGISFIEKESLALDNLRTLDLSGNRLTGLKISAFGETILPSLKKVVLGNNPLSCDCDLEWVAELSILSDSDIPAVCVEPPAMQGFDVRFAFNKHYLHQLLPCQVPKITTFGVQVPHFLTAAAMEPTVSLSIHCVATGYPKPRLHWVIEKQQCDFVLNEEVSKTSVKPKNLTLQYNFCEDDHRNRSDVRLKVLENGTLSLNEVPFQNALGNYVCTASNTAGTVEKSFFIRAEMNLSTHENLSSGPSSEIRGARSRDLSSLLKHASWNPDIDYTQHKKDTSYSTTSRNNHRPGITKSPTSRKQTRHKEELKTLGISKHVNTMHSTKFDIRNNPSAKTLLFEQRQYRMAESYLPTPKVTRARNSVSKLCVKKRNLYFAISILYILNLNVR